MVGFCEYGNEIRVAQNGGWGGGVEFAEQLNSSQLLEKDCAPRSYLRN